jgi:hypothetical protein
MAVLTRGSRRTRLTYEAFLTWLSDPPLIVALWLCDRIAGPMPDRPEPDDETIREQMGEFAP